MNAEKGGDVALYLILGAVAAAATVVLVGAVAATTVAVAVVPRIHPRAEASGTLLSRSPAEVIYAAYQNYPHMTPGLAQSIADVAERLGTNPYLLANVLRAESQFSPRAQNIPGPAWETDAKGRASVARFNPGKTATGILQFIPSTAASIGTSARALFNMSALQQMPYVERYLAQYRPLNSKQALYVAVFQPDDPARYGSPDALFAGDAARAQHPTPRSYMNFVDKYAVLNEDGSIRPTGSKYGYLKPPSPEILATEQRLAASAPPLAGASRIVVGRVSRGRAMLPSTWRFSP